MSIKERCGFKGRLVSNRLLGKNLSRAPLTILLRMVQCMEPWPPCLSTQHVQNKTHIQYNYITCSWNAECSLSLGDWLQSCFLACNVQLFNSHHLNNKQWQHVESSLAKFYLWSLFVFIKSYPFNQGASNLIRKGLVWVQVFIPTKQKTHLTRSTD